MLIDFYFDWFPGMDLQYANAVARPLSLKTIEGWKRYKFTVDIEDPNAPVIIQEVKAVAI